MKLSRTTLALLLLSSLFLPFYASAQKYACVNTEYVLKNMPDYIQAEERLNKYASEINGSKGDTTNKSMPIKNKVIQPTSKLTLPCTFKITSPFTFNVKCIVFSVVKNGLLVQATDPSFASRTTFEGD